MDKKILKILGVFILSFLIFSPKNINATALQLESGMTYSYHGEPKYIESAITRILKKNKKVIMYYNLGQVKETAVKNSVKNVTSKMNTYASQGGAYLRFTTIKPTKVDKNTEVREVIVKTFENGSKTICKSSTASGCADSKNLQLVTKYYVNPTKQNSGFQNVTTFHEILHTIGLSHLPQKTKGTSMTYYIKPLTHMNFQKAYPKDVELIKFLASRTTMKTTYNKKKTSRTIEFKKHASQVLVKKNTERKVKGKWVRSYYETRSYRNVNKKQLNSITSYNYNVNTKKVSSKIKKYYRSNNKISKQVRFNYNVKGKVVKRYEYVYNSKSQLKSNKNGQAIRYTNNYNKNGKFLKTVKQTYNSKGKLGKSIKVKKRTYF